MKKLFILSALLAWISTAVFADKVTVENITVPQGGEAQIVLKYQFDVTELYSGYQFVLEMPKGVATVKDADGKSTFVIGDGYDSSYIISSSYNDEKDRFVALSLQSVPISGENGVLLSIPVVSNQDLAVGTTLTAKVSGIQFGNKDGVNTSYIDDVSFSITIGEPGFSGTILDEKSTTAPTASDGAVNVQVKRTIYGNEWGTICLPFAMTAEQKTAAFGEDVILADYDSYEASDETDDDDNPISLTVNFTRLPASDGIEANHPYIIKTSKDITDFIVENVTIDPQDVEKGTKRKGRMYGNYVNGFTVPKEDLFISGNKFWYSVGKTAMKGFRCYFELPEVISSYYDESSSAKVNILFNDVSTGISNIGQTQGDDSNVYSLDGRLVSSNGIKSLPKGIYIKNGKKIIIK